MLQLWPCLSSLIFELFCIHQLIFIAFERKSYYLNHSVVDLKYFGLQTKWEMGYLCHLDSWLERVAQSFLCCGLAVFYFVDILVLGLNPRTTQNRSLSKVWIETNGAQTQFCTLKLRVVFVPHQNALLIWFMLFGIVVLYSISLGSFFKKSHITVTVRNGVPSISLFHRTWHALMMDEISECSTAGKFCQKSLK